MVDWQKLADNIDAFRPFPRAFMFIYGVLLWDVTKWFMALDAPNMAQGTLISVVWGAAAGWFGFYVNSGKKE